MCTTSQHTCADIKERTLRGLSPHGVWAGRGEFHKQLCRAGSKLKVWERAESLCDNKSKRINSQHSAACV